MRQAASRWFIALGLLSSLGACTYLETVTSRHSTALDERIVLGRRDSLVAVPPSEVSGYVCERNWVLECERAGSATMSCHCSLR